MHHQIFAIFKDVYYQLSEKKIFWLAIAISALIAGSFGAVSLNEESISLFGWSIDSPLVNSNTISPSLFYKTLLFCHIGVDFWLTSFAMIMAIISTGTLFPELLSSPATGLLISKPLSRLRLFLMKYFAGLLFVCLQVTLFSAISFLVIGVKTGSWSLEIFSAIPLVVLFFSYLFSVSVLIAHLKAPPLVCATLTLIFWSFTSGVHTANDFIESDTSTVIPIKIEKEEKGHAVWLKRLAYILPKTEETTDLIQHILDPEDKSFDIEKSIFGTIGSDPSSSPDEADENPRPSKTWVLGTSLAFEFILLSISAFLFCRKDF